MNPKIIIVILGAIISIIEVLIGSKKILNQGFKRRSLKLPWRQRPILPKYRTDTIEEEGYIGRTMQLRPEALDFGVE